MTQHADADTRRAQVASALVTVVAERGLARTTLADVARTAEVSVGLVQRYFRTKDELLKFGIEHVYRRTEERVAAIPVEPPIRDLVVRLMETSLPLTPGRHAEARVWLGFVQASLTDPEMAAVHRAATGRLIDGVRRALEGARHAGEITAGVDAAAEAAALVAFADGLCLHHAATGDGFDASRIAAALRTYVDRLFAP
ncbi:TetR/AcrR family transcriptional regulator [Actinomadura algeriensis]|uniref:AcrR family transcriptional regulator n=1 Tax=Actinomadura algeriensis TaxID=1679523 RepID=A0ABR9JVG0_9ACTN|nr:TetR family transcriptional regulator C-terminal domain-containing protein [Actinomadura algeriensis]MBE1534559.1 AcrR family transcriptional regulator [Actinomadura algeriensis]